MGVDGIGGGSGRPVGGVGPGEAAPVRATEGARESEVSGPLTGVSGSDSLKRLERGEIDVDRYLDGRVDEAVKHLEGRLPADQIDFVKQSLRDQIASDPVLVELVRRTTGTVPSQVE